MMATPVWGGHHVMVVRRCPTLPQGPPCSTIGAASLSFRVRNVSGRFPRAMAAETLSTNTLWGVGRAFHETYVVLCVARPYVGNHRVDASRSSATSYGLYMNVFKRMGVVIVKLSAY